MFRSYSHLSPGTALTEIKRAFRYSDHELADRLGVPTDDLQQWQAGSDRPSYHSNKRISEMLALEEALRDARSGKYRRA